MEGTKESTKVKSKAVTSLTRQSRQTSNVPLSTNRGVEPPMEARVVTSKESEKIIELLARLKDVTHSWPCKMKGQMPVPFISNEYIIFAFPKGGHVIENSVTSEGKQNFLVDGVPVIPVTSEV